MALLCSIATGNAGDAATWGVVDATSLLNSETGSDVLTTAYSGTRSSAFTPGTITISHLLVKLSVRTGTTGTISVSLRNATLGLDDFVTGTEVTINCSDLPVAATADLNGGWIAFKLATPILLLAATNYNIQAKTSSSTQVSLFRDGTTDNISRALVTTTTQAPVVGDDMIICREWTAAATNTARTVTWNITASTDFGATPTAAVSLVQPGIAISDGGTLSSGTTAATQYVMKMSNSIIIYSGGTFNAGTSGTPIPSGSSFTLTLDCGANVDYGLIWRNLSNGATEGTKGFTSSPSNHFTLLTADEAAGQSIIGPVLDTTGWASNDEICFSSTSRTSTEHQMCKIETISSATQFTLVPAVDAMPMSNGANAAILVAAKSGTNTGNEDTRCEIGNLTRNVKIQGASTTLQGYISVAGTAVVTLRKTEFRYLGSATTGKRGIDIATTTGTFDCQYCSVHTCIVAGSYAFNITSITGSGITISNNVVYNTSNILINLQGTITSVINNNLFCGAFATGNAITLGDIGITFTNNFITSMAGISIIFNEYYGVIGTNSGNVVHSGAGSGLSVSGVQVSGEISSWRVWRMTVTVGGAAGLTIDSGSPVANGPFVIRDLIAFGSSTRNMVIGGGHIRLISPIIFGGTTLTAPYAIGFGNEQNTTGADPGDITIVEIENGVFSGHSTADILLGTTGAGCRCVMHNTTLSSATEVSVTGSLGYGAFLCSLKHDTTVGNNMTWKPNGRTTGASLLTDTVIYNTASPSLRMYPGSATIRLEGPTWHAAVANGATLTPSVMVRYSKVGDSGGVAYVPTTAPRLVVRRNVAAGITADTVLATHGGGADWVTLSGTTVSVTDDCILEFFVDCDGSTGWINVDDFSCIGANPGGLKYWSGQHAGPLALGLPAGGGIIMGGSIGGGLQ